jgi:serine kinase of HPr protein (carbohydrate metabolism regulator)
MAGACSSVGRAAQESPISRLRLIDRGASLLSDDYTYVLNQEGAVIGHASPSIAGLIEVRGLGIMTLPFTAEAPLALVVRVLTKDEAQPERMPDAPRHATAVRYRSADPARSRSGGERTDQDRTGAQADYRPE